MAGLNVSVLLSQKEACFLKGWLYSLPVSHRSKIHFNYLTMVLKWLQLMKFSICIVLIVSKILMAVTLKKVIVIYLQSILVTSAANIKCRHTGNLSKNGLVRP